MSALLDLDSDILDKNAIICSDADNILQLKSYKQIKEYCEIIKKHLSKYFQEKHTCLGFLMERSVYTPAFILSMHEMKNAFIFLTQENLKESLETLKVNWILTLDNEKSIDLFKEVHKFSIDSVVFIVLWRRIELVLLSYSFKNIFCVVQTSGSTGKRKIVRVPYSCIEENANCFRKLFSVGSDDYVYWGTPLTFDPTWIEFLIAWYSKACLLIVPPNVHSSPVDLYSALFLVNKVTIIQIVPSVFMRWNEVYIQKILSSPNLKVLALGGETFPKCLLGYKRNQQLRVFNLYGITEVSCWASAYEIQVETEEYEVPLGEGIGDTRLEVRDDYDRTLQNGKGEIFIGSRSRVCYLDNEDSSHFEKSQEPLFRETGDVGTKVMGKIIFEGRKNKIIKRFGHKVNLNKIEDIIFKQTGLINRCIWSTKYNKIMTFFVINNSNFDKNYEEKMLDKIRIKIINCLPENSIPDYFRIINRMPLSCHGKVDEKSLELLYKQSDSKLSPGDTFCTIWCRLLGLRQENIKCINETNFFSLGGSSIQALQLIKEMEEATGIPAPDNLFKLIFEKQLKDCLKCLNSCNRNVSKRKISSTVKSKKIKVAENGINVSWTYDTKACVDGTPLVFEKSGEVFIAVGSFSHVFAVLNNRGEEVYKELLPDSIESKPLLSSCKQFLYVGCFDGVMYCLDLAKRLIHWQYKTGDRIKSSASACRKGTCLVFGSYDHKLYCLFEDGSEAWIAQLDGSISSTPLIHSNRIFVTTMSGICYCVEEINGTITWKYYCGKPIYASPCLVNENSQVIVASVDGKISCLSYCSGEVIWIHECHNLIFSSLVSFDNYVIFGCHDKSVYILKCEASVVQVVNRIITESAISSTPFIYKSGRTTKVVSACNSGIINLFDMDTFVITNSICLPSEIFSSPVVYKDNIYVGCRDNNLYCLNISDK